MIDDYSLLALSSKLSPAFYFMMFIFNVIINPSFNSIYLLICYGIVFLSVPIFKDLIFKPLYKITKRDTLPLLGNGHRPKGAMSCSLNGTNELSVSFGMPSGHSILAFFVSVYLILYIFNINFSEFRNPTIIKIIYLIISLLLIVLSVFIGYTRIFIAKCHTIQQVIVGSIIGSLLGYLTHRYKPVIQKKLGY